ncbi:LysM domain-containing protein [Malonomonas rubra DSM 5091]|uniref:LysM domain-containing protein n=1 Tax=Malonomonas rubra DSM 5091 TaxID=1122189 RepID=A0A1M6EYY7_MALRU|nr:LysM peptidoglycan-binding domain-containing protein [Malonomonas rubra]SHI90677.1 LysM domain-containing protein [Malonomonas rubra DSM 5091]
MTQTIFRWLSLLILVTIVTTLPASAEEGQIYTVKKGDTLWDISQRFIEDPYYWPNVWAHNPDISNPHLIFPGQKLRILDGKIEIIPAYKEAVEEQPAETEAEGEAPAVAEKKPEQTITLTGTGVGDGFILTNEQLLGTLVDSVDNRVLLTKGDMVFVKMKDLASVEVGDTYGLYDRGDMVKHPVSNEPVGTMMHNLGFLQVTEIKNETVVAKIGKAYREITRGAELFEYVPHRSELVLKQAAEALQGIIIATHDKKIIQGTNDIIFIDLGLEQQVESGNLLYISRPRQVSEELLKQAGDLDLPDEVLGAAVVIEPKNQTSTALIIKSADVMHIGDNITLVNE